MRLPLFTTRYSRLSSSSSPSLSSASPISPPQHHQPYGRARGKSSAGLGPTTYVVGLVTVLLLSLSYIKRDEVVKISTSVSSSAKEKYSSFKVELGQVADKGYHRYWQDGNSYVPTATGTNAAKPTVTDAVSAAIGEIDDGLEPEWRWARDVSMVYTWVNGSDPEYQALRQKHGGTLGSERDRDNDDLRFSLRALEQMLPWHTGTIYLVSPPDHIPYWLNASNPRFRYIDQNTLLPPEDVPSFNSNLIEAYFHLIPGLSDRFIVMNDDYFLAKPLHPEAFFTKDGGVKMYLEPWHMGIAETREGTRQWEKSLRYTAKAIKGVYGEIYHEKPRITEHAPFVFYKEGYVGLHHLFNSDIRKNGRHKFRHPEDLVIPFVHNAYVIQEGSRCCGMKYETESGQSPFFQWSLDEKENERKWSETVNDPRWKWFNVNDAMGDSPAEITRPFQEALRRKLEGKYPNRSSFELPMGSANGDTPPITTKISAKRAIPFRR